MSGNGEAVGHAGDIVADGPEFCFLSFAPLPVDRKSIRIGPVISRKISHDPLGLDPDRPQRVTVVEMDIEVAFQSPFLGLYGVRESDQLHAGGADVIDRLHARAVDSSPCFFEDITDH